LVDDSAPSRFRWPEGIAKCIVVLGDTVDARTHAPTACIQGYSRSRVTKW
jgi:hypothetical protein